MKFQRYIILQTTAVGRCNLEDVHAALQ